MDIYWIAVIFLLPRLLWVYHLMQCDAGGLACLTDVAVSSSESDVSIADMLVRVLHDRLWIEMGLGSLLMIIGWWYAENRDETLASMVCIGNSCLGLSISTLRPYHFRVLIVPMFILSIQGLSKLDLRG